MMQEEEIARDICSRFDHVLVDEYQDTNRLQASILLALKPDGKGLTVVGDDAQSIYSFRAATVRNILDFPNHFTPPARIVTLDRNYRSTQPILTAANAVIDLAAERSPEKPAFGSCLPPSARSSCRCATRPTRRAMSPSACWSIARPGSAEAASGAVPRFASQRPARNRADAAQHPVREIRRPEVSRGGPHQGRPGVSCAGRRTCAIACRASA